MINNLEYIPNILTILRIAVVPAVLLSFLIEDLLVVRLASSILFTIGAISDFADGYIARRFKIESNFGKCFDPIADKLLVVCTLLVLCAVGKANIVASCIIVAREIIISGIREYMGHLQIEIPVSKLAKWKTTFQLIAIIGLLLFYEGIWITISNAILYFATVLSVLTAKDYLKLSFSIFSLKPGDNVKLKKYVNNTKNTHNS